MQEIYRVKTSPVALSDNMIIGEKYRITVLTEALVRLEYSEDGVFEDRATQTVSTAAYKEDCRRVYFCLFSQYP